MNAKVYPKITDYKYVYIYTDGNKSQHQEIFIEE